MLLAHYPVVSQFETGESVNECGPFAVAMNKYAGKDAPGGSPEDVDVLADRLWNKFPHSPEGIDVPTLFNMLDDAGVHYRKIGSVEGNDHVENLTHETALHWLRQGYPLICTVNEKDVIDLDLGESPYPWLKTEPYFSDPPNHIFTLAGIADDGNVLVADPANANNAKGFPRRYRLDRLNFITLVAVILSVMFSNDLCVAAFNSYFSSIGKPPPPRDTGIFTDWRSQWMNGNYKGCCLSAEYPVTLPNGDPGVAQNFAGGTCVWNNKTGRPTWL